MVTAGYVHHVYGQIAYGGKELGLAGGTVYLVAVGAALWLSAKGKMSQRLGLWIIATVTSLVIPCFIYDGAVSHLPVIILWLAGDVEAIDLASQLSGLAELVFAIPLVLYTYRFISAKKSNLTKRETMMPLCAIRREQ